MSDCACDCSGLAVFLTGVVWVHDCMFPAVHGGGVSLVRSQQVEGMASSIFCGQRGRRVRGWHTAWCRSGLGSLEMFSMGLKATGSYVSRWAPHPGIMASTLAAECCNLT